MFSNLLAISAADVRVFALMGITLGIVAVLLGLGVIIRREWVKQNLPRNCARWLTIRWAPFAPGWGAYWRPAFRVRYVDDEGRVHRAYCRPRDITWHPPLVWLKDELTGEQAALT